MTGTAGNVTPVQGSAIFNLRIKNPCIDSIFVQIQTAALPAGPQSYTLFFNSLESPFSIITHSAWSYSTTPIAHTLCGTISYTATFEGSSVDTTTISSRNVVYNSNIRTIGIYSENFALIGTRTVTVSADLT